MLSNVWSTWQRPSRCHASTVHSTRLAYGILHAGSCPAPAEYEQRFRRHVKGSNYTRRAKADEYQTRHLTVIHTQGIYNIMFPHLPEAKLEYIFASETLITTLIFNDALVLCFFFVCVYIYITYLRLSYIEFSFAINEQTHEFLTINGFLFNEKLS